MDKIVVKFFVFKPTNGEIEMYMVHKRDSIRKFRNQVEEEVGALDYIIEVQWNEVRDLIIENSGVTVG